MIKNFLKTQKGSIALISILVIAAFSLILAVGMSEVNISTSYQYLNNTANTGGYYLAEACLEESIIRLEEDSSFSAESLAFSNGDSCTVSVTGVNPKTVAISTTYATDYLQNFQATLELSTNGQVTNATLSNWQEI